MKRDNERAARLLVEAALHGDVKVSEQAGITRQTIHNYRKALSEDADLLRLFIQYSNELLTRTWADELESALTLTITTLVQHISGLESFTPESIKAITEALKALSEIAMTREVLNAGQSEQNQTITSSGPADPRG